MDNGVNSQRRELLVLFAWCLLLMLAWGLWLWRLDASDLTFDEAVTYFVAHRPLLDILDYLGGRSGSTHRSTTCLSTVGWRWQAPVSSACAFSPSARVWSLWR